MYRLQPLLFQPVASEVGMPFSDIVEEVRAAYFPEVDYRVEVRIARSGPLAYISYGFMGPQRPLIVFHPVLNHRDTPLEVLRFIAKHELAHIVRPPRAGMMHPPEFWELELAVGPEHYAAWHWLYANIGRSLRTYPTGLRVTPAWRQLRDVPRKPYTPHLPFDDKRFEHYCPEGGAQLRVPPEWVVRPLPLASSE